MKFLKIPLTLLIIIITHSSHNDLNASTFFSPEPQEDPKTGFAITFRGGAFFSMISTKDDYFNTNTFRTNIFSSAGIGLLVDIPLSAKTRFLLNPEVQAVSFKRTFSSFNLSVQKFLSESFFVLGGVSCSLDNFTYGGIGPNLGLGVKVGGRSSFYIEGKLQYKKLEESQELVTYSAYSAPVSLVYRLDLSRTFRKSKTSPGSTPATPVQKQEIPQPKKEQIVMPPIRQDTTVTVIPSVQNTPEPVKADTTIIKTPEKSPVRMPVGELSNYAYNDLVLFLESMVSEEEYQMAEKIQTEIVRREAGVNLGEIPLKRLQELLDEAVNSENYNRAALIQEEIEKR